MREKERELRKKKKAEGNFKQFLQGNEVIALLAVERDVGYVDSENDGVGEDDGTARWTAKRNSLDASCFADAENNAVAPRLVFVNLPWHLNNGK